MSAACPELRPAPTEAPRRTRRGVEFGLGGDLRYLGHHDELRMLTRALVRARWPLAWTRGFNPRPRVVLPLPRGLGAASDSELAVVDLWADPSAAELAAGLASALPAGCTLRHIVTLDPRCMPRARGVVYEVALAADDAARVAGGLPALAGAATLVVQRTADPRRPPRPVDIRTSIETLTLDGGHLHLHLRVENQRTARPSEILTLLGLPADAYAHRVRRTKVDWDMLPARPVIGPGALERTGLGEENDEEGLGRSQEDRHAAQADHAEEAG